MEKILTVSIAAYNTGNYIKKAMESLLDQRIMDDLEILIIDDGGKDATLQIAKEYERSYPLSVHAVHKENGGYGSVINYAIKAATGKYFKQLDGDDWFDTESLVKLTEILKSNDVDYVLSPRITWHEDTGKTEKLDFAENLSEGNYEFEGIELKKGINMHGSTFRTSILKNMSHAITEHCFYTDNELVYYPLPYLKTLYIMHDAVYWYRVGLEGQSVSVTGIRKHYREHESVLFRLLDIYKYELKEDTLQKKNLLRHRLRSCICGQYSFYCMLEYTIKHKEELIEFDKKLQKECPELLAEAENASKFVKLLRKSHFILYPLMIRVKRSIV